MKTTKQLQREARQLFRFCLIEGSLNEDRVRQAVQEVLRAKRRGGLKLLSYFQHFVKLERDRHRAEIESAISLPDELRANVLSNLDRLYGPGLNTSFAINPSLIGGMRIRVGCDVYDRSVRAELASLQKSF